MGEPEGSAPAIRVRGPATAEDVAAIVAVLAAASGEGGSGDVGGGGGGGTASTWAAHTAALRRPVGHGPAAWRTSLRP